MKCEQSLEMLSDFHAGELDDTATTGVNTHLAECPPCADIYQELTVIVETAVTLRASKDTITYPDENLVWQRITVSATSAH